MAPIDRTMDVEEGLDFTDGSITTTTSTVPSEEQALARQIRSTTPPERALHRTAALRALPGVVLHVHQISPDGKVEMYDKPYAGLEKALLASQETANTTSSKTSKKQRVKLPSYWVHVDADERDRIELNEWIDRLNFGSFLSDQIKRPAEHWLSHVVSTRSKALIMIRILPLMDQDGDFIANRVEYLAAVATRRMLLTYTTTESGGRNNLSRDSMKYMTQEELLNDGSSSAALLAWLEFHVLRTRKALDTLRKKALMLVKQMDDAPKSVDLDDVRDISDNLLVVLAVAEEQAQSLAMIKDMDKDTDGVDFTHLRGALSILVATSESTERMGQRIEKRAKGLKHAFEAHQQSRMNRRLAILTVVSAIFMPLTFMAGIYGMNFANVPELEYENSYFILLATMLVIATSMLLFFYMDGWFK